MSNKDYKIVKFWKEDVKDSNGRITIAAGWHYKCIKK